MELRWQSGNFQKNIYFPQNQDVSDRGDVWGLGYKVTREGLVHRGVIADSFCSPCPKPEDLTQKKTPWDLSYCDVYRIQVVGLIKPILLSFLMWVWGSVYPCSFSVEQLRDTVVLVRACSIPGLDTRIPTAQVLTQSCDSEASVKCSPLTALAQELKGLLQYSPSTMKGVTIWGPWKVY